MRSIFRRIIRVVQAHRALVSMSAHVMGAIACGALAAAGVITAVDGSRPRLATAIAALGVSGLGLSLLLAHGLAMLESGRRRRQLDRLATRVEASTSRLLEDLGLLGSRLDERSAEIGSVIQLATRELLASGDSHTLALNDELRLRSDELHSAIESRAVELVGELATLADEIRSRRLAPPEDAGELEEMRKTDRADLLAMGELLYARIEALMSVNAALRPGHPLPELGGWAVSPQTARLLVAASLRPGVELVVETGSGASTALLGLALKQKGSGRVVALEHDRVYFEKTEQLLLDQSLGNFATVVYAPLRTYTIGGDTYQWYDVPEGVIDSHIDLLLVDGPPQGVGHLARYPVIGELSEWLDAKTTVIVDDANRPDEQQMLARWEAEYGAIVEELSLERGAAIVRIPK